MTNQKNAHDVIVHKANAPISKGESLADFSIAVGDAGKTFVRQQLNLDSKKSDVFVIEIFSGSVVFDVFTFGSSVRKRRFFAVAYTRNAQQGFEFSNLTEVQRVVSFEAKPQGVPVTKTAGAEGWVDTKKASADMWYGVI